MKPGFIIALVFFLLFLTGTAGSNYSPKAISENDTMLIIGKKNLHNSNINTFYNSLFQDKYLTALPDTTRDIIIIFRNNNWRVVEIMMAEGKTLRQPEKVVFIRPSVSNIFKG